MRIKPSDVGGFSTKKAGAPLGGIAIGLWGWQSVFYLTFLVFIAGFIVSYISIPRDSKAREVGFPL
ncbi:MAG: hypothetical protein K0B01_03660 [Syntrophobacterales bacterium]|nr:hypothetical protein [Syntrophobacterales bacterium]